MLFLAFVAVMVFSWIVFSLSVRGSRNQVPSGWLTPIQPPPVPPSPVLQADVNLAGVFAVVAPSVVVVSVSSLDFGWKVQGSGVAVGKDLVATNRHVVDGGSPVRVDYRGASYAASVSGASPAMDLCLLSVPGLPASPARLVSSHALAPGSRVYAVGAPKGLDLTITEGVFSAVREVHGAGKMVQASAPISKGSSGGGLFDSEGGLVGITTMTAEGVGLYFSVPSEAVSAVFSEGVPLASLPRIDPAGTPPSRASFTRLESQRQEIEARKSRIAAIASEMEAVQRYIDNLSSAMREQKQAMEQARVAGDTDGYNALVPVHNRNAGEHNAQAAKYRNLQVDHNARVDEVNRMVSEYNRSATGN